MICPKDKDDVYVLLSALDIDLGYKITADYLHDGGCTLYNSLQLAEFYDTVDGSDGRLSRVVKLASPGRLDVDVLVSSDSTIREAVARFDYNINQFVIRRAGAAYPVYVGDTPAGTLHLGRSGYVSTDRTAHIRRIAAAYNWSGEV
ncbi:hypothetical protein pphageT12_16 [Pseudomonas phage pphageT12]|uniref:Uncharacterized protein n=1 Tax=Pseudomonas phage phiB1_1 TaxID=2755402 RepID=A0A7D7F0N6_9CAUD|nr:hypothetical protein phiB1_1_10 [Pseudomonas phage phiB1_1]UAW53649.1 hypothetical protein pphageB21_16 [Pseudomonas phage pphageB21]UAW53708.1 hypothetical protein pphageT21_16 [Pseudomonas phage pphageT21]UAW53767.1 hypothetical protein pphageT12_16 [Pseudomonas phage pphageT12]UAW53828.1 hypothetical protein pphageBV72_16 [Pseudomonas phage pphageBV72]